MTGSSRAIACPTCRKETTYRGNPFRPFCSERCKLLDLGNWTAEAYRVPSEELSSEGPPPEETG